MSVFSGRALAVTAVALSVAGVLAAASLRRPQDRFGHEKHARLFPSCTTCHAGAATTGQPMWPEPASCEACHDGTVAERIEWQPRQGPRVTNLRFDHGAHAREAVLADTVHRALAERCVACHTEAGAQRMAVQHAVVGQCLDCHQLGAEHLAVADRECAECHVPLAAAALLSAEDVAGFPEPPSHAREGFAVYGHAEVAQVRGSDGEMTVAQSCATCHAREFCITCHVNAPEVPAIQSLALDARSLVHRTELPKPATHDRPDYVQIHGQAVEGPGVTCAACHTQESCRSCHVGSGPRSLGRIPRTGPGRGPGAQLTRELPASHTWEFRDRHGGDADARPSSCSTCHVRQDCLDCHRPSPGGAGSYHPNGFLPRHPTAAWGREAGCSDCHNPGQFCQSCHRQAGLTALGRIGTGGYHDAKRAFSVGHGQAARQTLESCASCHAERDCTACHSAVSGGFRFNPHGPRFDAERLRRKNPSFCTACHGTAIPGR